MEHYDVFNAMFLTYRPKDGGVYMKHVSNVKSNKIKLF